MDTPTSMRAMHWADSTLILYYYKPIPENISTEFVSAVWENSCGDEQNRTGLSLTTDRSLTTKAHAASTIFQIELLSVLL